MKPLLEVQDLTITLQRDQIDYEVVHRVSFQLRRGESLGLVGESGSGKSLTVLALGNLLPGSIAKVTRGRLVFDGSDLRAMSHVQMSHINGRRIAYIFQDPMSSLNPLLTVGYQIMEPLRRHLNLPRSAARARAIELLEMVGISDPARRVDDYPHEFSGGMRQRVMIAAAISCGPDLLIADEPTTALDVTVQAQILELIADLRREMGMAVILITHDFGVVAGYTDRVAVMYAGRIVETSPVAEIFAVPQMPYTEGLLKAMPNIASDRQSVLKPIPGTPPSAMHRWIGCAFHPRCRYAQQGVCDQKIPSLEAVAPGHLVACLRRQAIQTEWLIEAVPGDIS